MGGIRQRHQFVSDRSDLAEIGRVIRRLIDA
jgi:hypothetical protein